MFIPRKKLAEFVAQTIQECTPDIEERIQRGALYRNLYLTGDENGNPATFNKTFAHISTLSSMYFSPLELRYDIQFHGGGNLTHRAMGRTASGELHEMMTEARVYDRAAAATKWSLVKGTSFVKMNWEDEGFAPYMVQPEFLGVMRPDVNDLNHQPAFVHTTYYTPSEFASTFRNLDNIVEIMRKIAKKGNRGNPDQRPDRANALKQIVLGGLNPFQQAGNSPAAASSRGQVAWLGGPQATFDPKIMAQLIRLDELWVRDTINDDWATFQAVGDVLVTGENQIRNAFADMYDPKNPMRRLPEEFRKNNPLTGMHPFVPFCPNELDGYFWGRSEICNIGVLQMQLNARLDGIARLLRRQEKPPRLFTGTTAISRDKYSALDMPGGYFVDPSPQAKQQVLYPELPEGLWQSFHELVEMIDEMSGMPPVMRGRGESGVRAQGHAQTLTQNASPRFKTGALSVERSIADLGALALAMCRAMDNRTMVSWLMPETTNAVALMPPDDKTLEPPAPGMKQYPFRWMDIPSNAKVKVDSHSSSPIFGNEARELLFALAKIGAVEPEEIIEHLAPPGAEEMLVDIDRKKVAQAELLKQHPELLAELAGGGRKKKR
jgi:hypothetical protein